MGGLIHRDNRGAEGRHNDVTPPLSVDAVWLNSGCLRCFFFVQRERKVSPVTEQDRLLLYSTDSRDTSVLEAEITTSHDRSNHRPSHSSLSVFELAEICTEKENTPMLLRTPR